VTYYRYSENVLSRDVARLKQSKVVIMDVIGMAITSKKYGNSSQVKGQMSSTFNPFWHSQLFSRNTKRVRE